MTKINFLLSLRDKLSHLPPGDVEQRLQFYSEMIEDRMEEGLSEEEAVSAVGSVEEIAGQILSDCPPAPPAKEKKPKRQLTGWEIALIILGAPLWLSLLVAGLAVAVSLYASLWSLIVSLWAVFGSVIACGIGGIVGGAVMALTGKALTGIFLMGAGLVCAGIAIFLLFGCKAATRGTLLLTKKLVLGKKRGTQ